MKDKIKAVLAGCGSISRQWLKVILNMQNVSLVGLVDLNRSNAESLKNNHSLTCDIYADINAALKEAQPDIVIDCTIPEAHYGIVTAALENGCHVFGEKPLADSMANALSMVSKANEKGLYYSVMQNRRYNKKIRAFGEILRNGFIGKAGYIGADFFLGPHFVGFRDLMQSPLILDMAIHTFDQARFITSCDPLSVYCHEYNPPGSWYAGSANACCVFEMSNDVVFSYNGSWCSKGLPTSWESEWRVNGSSGSAAWDGINDPYYESAEHDPLIRIVHSYSKDIKEGHEGCIDEMFIALLENRPAETDCNDNIKSYAMVTASILSAKEKRRVLISEVMK